MVNLIEAARRTVCANSSDMCEARDFMLMLGIYPGQEDDGDSNIYLPNHPSTVSRRLQ